MKFRKQLLAGLLCCTLVFAVGCSNGSNSSDGSGQSQEQSAPDVVGKVSLETPIYVDKQAGTITTLASVNGKYFTEPTRHASVFKDGTNGTKSILTSYATATEFFDALESIGAKAGENMTPDNKTTTHVQGDPIKVEVTWNGADKSYDINEVIKDSNGKKISMRYGGNRARAEKVNTGCLTCLDSCPVGIISNETYTYGAVETRGEVKFTGNADVLPEDGTYVAVTYSIQK